MAKDPAFLFYTGDFSTGTQFFSDEQVGKYLRLLMAQHQHGHLSEKQMLQICKTHDIDIWSKFERDGDGNYYQKRLEIEVVRRKSYSESRSKNRTIKKKTKKIKPNNISNSYQLDMENKNKTITITDIEDRKEIFLKEVSLFRNQYSDELLKEFYEYWSEHNPKSKKFRKEFEKVFDIERRLRTWNKNKDNFSKHGTGKQITKNTVEDIIAASHKVADLHKD